MGQLKTRATNWRRQNRVSRESTLFRGRGGGVVIKTKENVM